MEQSSVRVVQTHQFGTIEVGNEHIFHFADGIYGFEELREFVLISDEQSEPIKWLVSLTDPSIGFAVIDVFLVMPSYKVNPAMLGEKPAILSIVTLSRKEGAGLSANLKAPIILDVDTQSGFQMIHPSEKYSTEHIFGQAQ